LGENISVPLSKAFFRDIISDVKAGNANTGSTNWKNLLNNVEFKGNYDGDFLRLEDSPEHREHVDLYALISALEKPDTYQTFLKSFSVHEHHNVSLTSDFFENILEVKTLYECLAPSIYSKAKVKFSEFKPSGEGKACQLVSLDEDDRTITIPFPLP